jgi:LuxR family transcriptional regulator, quorum-sensing system regulator SolR
MVLSTEFNKLKHHLALTSSPVIAEMMLPQLQKHGIKIFNFIRRYDDSSIIRLSSDANWNEHYFQKGYINKQNKVPPGYLTKSINYFIWLTNHWPEMLIDYAVNFDTANGITVAEQCNGYIDFFCFGANANNTSIVNFYLNHLDLLQRYGHYFRERANVLLKAYEKDKIVIPNNAIYPLLNGAALSDSQGHHSSFKLTNRENDCARLLILGKKIKEIASTLNLSPRTVESHINNLKVKFDCRNKLELAIKLSKTQDLYDTNCSKHP